MNETDNRVQWFPTYVICKVWKEHTLLEKTIYKAIMFDKNWKCSTRQSYDYCYDELNRKYPREKFPTVWFEIEAKVKWQDSFEWQDLSI